MTNTKKLILSEKLLLRISKYIDQGQPIWGMLMANEYMDTNSPLYRGLQARALDAIESLPVKKGDKLKIRQLIGKSAPLALEQVRRTKVLQFEKPVAQRNLTVPVLQRLSPVRFARALPVPTQQWTKNNRKISKAQASPLNY